MTQVYLGSKPNGVLKVCSQLDPFRSGGPAGPVRRKFKGVATQGGLTIALRPIKQNPQIAGVVISGYSYSPAFLSDLPTKAQGPDTALDFSIVDSTGPVVPPDPEMVYDPSLNPKFKTGISGGSPTTAGSFRSPPTGNTDRSSLGMRPSIPSSGQSFAFPSPGNQFPSGLRSFQTPGPNTFGIQASNEIQGSPGMGTGGAYRRRLASYNDYGESEVDVATRIESLNNKIAQEQYAMNLEKGRDIQPSNAQPVTNEGRIIGGQNQGYNAQPHATNTFQQGVSLPEQGGPPSFKQNEPSSYGYGIIGATESQAAMQSPQGPGAPLQREASSLNGADPNALRDDATQAFYQAQSEAMQTPTHYQSQSATQSSSGWSGDQTRMPGQDSQQAPGMVRQNENPNAQMPSAGTPLVPNYDGAQTTERQYQGQNGMGFNSHGAPAGPAELNNERGGQFGNSAPLYQSPAGESNRAPQEAGQVSGNHGGYIEAPSNNMEQAQSLDMIQTRHVERMVQPNGQLPEAPQYGRQGSSGSIDQRNNNMGQRYSSPDMTGGAQGLSQQGQLPSSGRQTIPGFPDIPGMPGSEGAGQEAEPSQSWTPGIHNGPAGLEGMCIDNSTHCSCGMAEQRSGQQEECLFVVREDVSPLICARRPCNAQLVCACAAGANTLCKRSVVKHILVPASVHKHGVTEEPNVVLCKREVIEQGVGVLSPII